MKTWLRFILLITALTACRARSEPTDPVWGKQACESCKMLLSDPRYAAQVLDAGGERVFFDDIGCLAEYLRTHPDTGQAIWVRDETSHWRDARTTKYKTGAKTPMDYGFVAAADGLLDFNAVKQRVASRTVENP